MTLEEITAREGQLLDQIAECKRLLAAYQLIRAECDRSPAAAAPAPAAPEVDLVPVADPVPSGASVAPPHVNLQLRALSEGWAGTGRAIRWVLQRTTGEFTLRDVAAALRNEGCPIPLPKISVVLSRMMSAREITRTRNGRGRAPSIFRAEPLPPGAAILV